MGDGCNFWDVKCHLKNTPLGGIAKALDKPWQMASGNIASALHGTPLGSVGDAISLGSRGKINEAYSAAAKGALDIVSAAVPGLNAVPGIGLLKDGVLGMVSGALNPKNAGGAGSTAGINSYPAGIGSIVANTTPNLNFAQQQGSSGLLPPVPALPAPPGGVAAVLSSAAAIVPARGAKRPARSFTNEQWRAHASQAGSVGGTQMWGTP